MLDVSPGVTALTAEHERTRFMQASSIQLPLGGLAGLAGVFGHLRDPCLAAHLFVRLFIY